ncbi:MAG: HEAT repeat domain-containing protein, partial [Ignavibacteria bacterium]|nr:HEAT repeat domain-containing protein [Ignavibacteria bacterium]
MIFYCTNCWNEISETTTICPFCSYDQRQLERETFVNKLIKALNNPEPQTPIRAAKILGELKCQESIPFLFEKLTKESDPFIIESFVKALLQIDKSNTKHRV